MKKVFITMFSSLLFIMGFFSSCKEFHKRNIEAENEAEAEIRSEKLDEEIKMLEYQSSKLPKSESEITHETSVKQGAEMDKNKFFVFCKNKEIGYKFTKIKKIKIKCSDNESEVNAKYKIYLKAKELNGDGIIDYKMNFTPFYVSGIVVKKQ